MIDEDAPEGLVDRPRPTPAAEERVAELETRLAENLERQRVLEVEIAALRSDLAVKVAYTSALEESARERQDHISWLQARFDTEHERARLAVAELAAERARISYRIMQGLVSVVRPRRPPA